MGMSGAVSHQWFVQWSHALPPLAGPSYDVDPRLEYSWVNFHTREPPVGTREPPGGTREPPGGTREPPGGTREPPGGTREPPGGPRELPDGVWDDGVPARTHGWDGYRGVFSKSAFENKNSRWEKQRGLNGGLHMLGAAMWLSMLRGGGGWDGGGGGGEGGAAHEYSIPTDNEAPPFKTLYKWRQLDFEFPSAQYRDEAISTGAYIPENVLPLGIEVWEDRVFVTVPSWKRGLPATLGTVPRAGGIASPLLRPYPDWTFHRYGGGNCSGLTSVFRVSADKCGRLWVLDSGQVEAVDSPKQLCPPALVVFQLATDRLIARYIIPPEYVLQNSLYSNLVTDTRSDDCSDTHVYISDTWRFGMLVFREYDERFWRFSHPFFYPDPLASNYTLHGVNFQWSDGLFGLSLSPIVDGDRTVFFHSMSSYREFHVKASVIRSPERVNTSANEFHLLGEDRGESGQVSASAVDRRGVMFYNLVLRDAVGCWSTRRPYRRRNFGVVASNRETMVFPNDLKIDQEERQSVWVITNRLPMYQVAPLDPDDFNFRILYTDAREAVRGTPCDVPSRNAKP